MGAEMTERRWRLVIHGGAGSMQPHKLGAEAEKCARGHDLDARVLAKGEEAAIARDKVTCPPLESRSDVLVVVGIVADPGEFPVRNDVG